MENAGPANHFCSLDSKWNVIKIAFFIALQHEPGPWLFPESRLSDESIHNAVNSYISWVHKFLRFIHRASRSFNSNSWTPYISRQSERITNRQYISLNYLTVVYTNWHIFKALNGQKDEKFLCLTQFLWLDIFRGNQRDLCKFYVKFIAISVIKLCVCVFVDASREVTKSKWVSFFSSHIGENTFNRIKFLIFSRKDTFL